MTTAMKDDAEPKAPHREDEGPTAGVDETSGNASRASELEARLAEMEARWLRAQADYQNLRRRAPQELESALFHTLKPLLEELLFVADYLDMALSAPATSNDAKALRSGVELTRTKLMQALELVDVRPIPSSGKFDPALHEAAETRREPGKEPGTILATTRPGYTWQGRILRHARVVVAASPERAEAKPREEPK